MMYFDHETRQGFRARKHYAASRAVASEYNTRATETRAVE